jgi:hypothetical protein
MKEPTPKDGMNIDEGEEQEADDAGQEEEEEDEEEEENDEQGEEEEENDDEEEEEELANISGLQSQGLSVGDDIEVLYDDGQWYRGKIVDQAQALDRWVVEWPAGKYKAKREVLTIKRHDKDVRIISSTVQSKNDAARVTSRTRSGTGT